MNNEITKELPDKLWQLLELAIKDAQACQADSAFRLNMLEWLAPDPNDPVCHVCMAGAVMAKTLNCRTDEEWCPTAIGGITSEKLRAINNLRFGDVIHAQWRLHHRNLTAEHVATLDQSMDLLDEVSEVQTQPWLNDWKAHKDLAALLKEMDI